MAVKFIGKFLPNGEPERYIVGVPCRDLDDAELRELAKAEGKRRDVYERELTSGPRPIFALVEKQQEAPAETVSPAKEG